MRKILIIAVLLSLLGAGNWLASRPIAHSPGILVADAPRQTPPADATPLAHDDYRITPRADFDIKARVLSRADYRMDADSSLAPMDLALGWGRMSDTAVIEQLDMEQSARFYTYRWKDSPPIPPAEITRSSANMHLIPADDAIARDLGRIRKGDIVRLRGRLVSADRTDGYRWMSSLTREDSGGGACELVFVDAVERR